MTITQKRIGIVVLVAALTLTTFAVQIAANPSEQTVQSAYGAAVDYFLKIEGIDGESTASGHRNEIDLESWSWGESRPSTGGGGGGAGKVSMQDFHFTMKMSKASPKLMLAVATGEHIKEAKLTARKAGGDQQEFMTIKLSDVLITGYQTGASGGDVPTDQISLNFTKIEFEYKPQKADGTLDAPVKAGYDLKKGTKI